ncbi:MAG TPA: hypothetical protein EYN13_01225 [Methylococcales bacterium]|jgi:hypothetical protein|nr:hypothetical protein [Methylococcales bacterium]
MMCYKRAILFLWLVLPFKPLLAWEVSGYGGVESLGFWESPLENQQRAHYLSAVVEAEFYHEWDNGRESLVFVPFFRWSEHDDRRTHFDIRELNWLKAADRWELRIGIRKEFWGVTESQHLVDIINQTDVVENLDTEDKLGQPMINLALIDPSGGTLDLFLLTGFREAVFPGTQGRLRLSPRANTEQAYYEHKGIERHLAYAARYTRSVSQWDFALSFFHGTSRAPRFLMTKNNNGDDQFTAYYEQINQGGLELQFTDENWLWKFESIVREGQGRTYFAGTGGLEYTWFDIFSSGADFGVLVEYLYDSRGFNAPVFYQDDFMTGCRLTLNDIQSSELLAGLIIDRRRKTQSYSIEGSRRLGDNWKMALELRMLTQVTENDFTYSLRKDDQLRFELSYYF